MGKIYVIYEGKEYILLHQSSTGFCQIGVENTPDEEIKLVHFSEISLKK